MSPTTVNECLLAGVTLTRSANVLRVSSASPLRVLGCPHVGDDLALTRNIVLMPMNEARQSEEPEQQLLNWAMQAGIQEPFMGVLTSATADSCVQATEETAKWQLTTLLFADNSTLYSAGKSMQEEGGTEGSIDIILLTDASLSMGAMVSAMITATEAKVGALVESGAATREGYIATGAQSDSVIVGCLSRGERIRQAGPATEFGHLVGKMVHEGLTKALQAQHVE